MKELSSCFLVCSDELQEDTPVGDDCQRDSSTSKRRVCTITNTLIRMRVFVLLLALLETVEAFETAGVPWGEGE